MKTDTKARILQTAGALFAKNGYNGVSIREIARAVGIKEASIYNHFVSKEEILNELLNAHEEGLKRAMPQSRALIDAYDQRRWKPAWAVRIRLMEKYAGQSDQSILMILMNEQYRLPKARDIIRKYYMEAPVQVTLEFLTHLQKTGTTLPADAMTLARAYQYPIFCMLQEYEMTLSAGEDAAPVLCKIKAHVDFFWKDILKLDYEDA